MHDKKISGETRVEFNRRLGTKWRELAEALEIDDSDIRRFKPGEEGFDILNWLDRQNRLADLPGKLKSLGCKYLASLVTGQLAEVHAKRAEHLAAYADKSPQLEYFRERTSLHNPLLYKNAKAQAFAFILAGVWEEWPSALITQLLLEYSGKPPHENQPLKLLHTRNDDVSQILWSELSGRLSCDPSKEGVEAALSISRENKMPEFFYHRMESTKLDDFQFVVNIVTAWESLQLTPHAPHHFLFIMYDAEDLGLRLFKWAYGVRKVSNWLDRVRKHLHKNNLFGCVLPELSPPTKNELNEWMAWLEFQIEDQAVKQAIEQKINKRAAFRKLRHKTVRDLLIEAYSGI